MYKNRPNPNEYTKKINIVKIFDLKENDVKFLLENGKLKRWENRDGQKRTIK
jgi:hypothetical protein